MPKVFIDVKDLDLSGYDTTKLEIADNTYTYLSIAVTMQSETDDVDIKVANGVGASLSQADKFATSMNNPEILNINSYDAVGIHVTIFLVPFYITNKVNVLVTGYTRYEQHLMPIGTDAFNVIRDNLDDTDDNTDDNYEDISGDILSGLDSLNNNIGVSISNLRSDLNTSFAILDNSISSDISAMTGSINNQLMLLDTSTQNTFRLATSEIGNSLDYQTAIISSSMSGITSEIHSGISELAESLDSKITNPLVMALADVSASIKGISNGVIDDILLSIFKPV